MARYRHKETVQTTTIYACGCLRQRYAHKSRVNHIFCGNPHCPFDRLGKHLRHVPPGTRDAHLNSAALRGKERAEAQKALAEANRPTNKPDKQKGK